ncbi:RHS repeat domain-containing protein [Fimbriiglobus ruber]|uniref:Rhs family protein n=1 Tax=Fimbriiglobus ruber TaxID=1908690 RepID=A0A225DA06_9BACT|nr:RHS repeat domain-containing protein [Fimbriiglobus ruber]OWK38391.1 Rhs family protein [Fimbriiglobus ruber]
MFRQDGWTNRTGGVPGLAGGASGGSAGGSAASFANVSVYDLSLPAGQTTTTAYQWFTGAAALQYQQTTVTTPAVSAAENGSGVAATTTTVYDDQGRPVWVKDANGYLDYTAYDPATGAVVTDITDVDTTRTGDFTGLPAGWATPAGGGAHLKTVTTVDDQGRPTEVVYPNGSIDYMVYDDAAHEMRTHPGWTGTTTTGPVRVDRTNWVGGSVTVGGQTEQYTYTEDLTMAPTTIPVDAEGRPTGAEPISNIQSLVRDYYSPLGELVWHDVYFDLTGLTYADGSGNPVFALGTEGTNFLRTRYGYDSSGREDRVQTPAGTITRTVYDALGRVSSTWVGTNDSPASSPDEYVTGDASTLGTWVGTYGSQGYVQPGSYGTSLPATATVSVSGASTYTWAGGTTDPRALETPDESTRNAACWYSYSGFTIDVDFTDSDSHLVTLYFLDWDNSGRVEQVDLKDASGTVVDSRTISNFSAGLYESWVVTGDAQFVITFVSNVNAVVGGVFIDNYVPVWSPADNVAPADMVDVADYVYDNGGVGDGNLTQLTQHPGGGAADRVTDYWYDWRDRLVAEKDGVETTETDGVNRPLMVYTYDNLDEVTETQVYVGDGITPSIVDGVLSLPTGAASALRAQATTSYDELGQAYRTQVFDVDPTTGAVSTSTLTTNDYYDPDGDVIAESAPGGLWTKDVYDGAGRVIIEYTTDGAGGTTYADAASVSGDHVLTQTEVVYDGDGNPIETITRDRFATATGTGALGTPTTGVNARVSYAASYYDAADRDVADVNVGTNGGAAWTRPATVPARSATVLVTSTAYDAAGNVASVTDPLGLVTAYYYDVAGRTTEEIDDYTDGTPTADSNQTTLYAYGPAGLTSQTAVQVGGPNQTTQYVYGVTIAGGSGIDDNDIVGVTEWPDPTTGAASTSLEDTVTVNALGQVVTSTDRNGTTHTYTYDVLGRVTSDAVTTLGTGVDGSVRRIDTAYDSQGNPYLVTSYDTVTGGSIVNQVEDVFNGLGQLTGEYQAVGGAVNTSTTPEVQYTYTEMAGGRTTPGSRR